MNSNIKPVNFRLVFIEKPFQSAAARFFTICERVLSTFCLPARFINFHTYRDPLCKNRIDCSNNNQHFIIKSVNKRHGEKARYYVPVETEVTSQT